MSQPNDTNMISDPEIRAGALDAEEIITPLDDTLEDTFYAQIAARRSQLEDAETLRRVRAL